MDFLCLDIGEYRGYADFVSTAPLSYVSHQAPFEPRQRSRQASHRPSCRPGQLLNSDEVANSAKRRPLEPRAGMRDEPPRHLQVAYLPTWGRERPQLLIRDRFLSQRDRCPKTNSGRSPHWDHFRSICRRKSGPSDKESLKYLPYEGRQLKCAEERPIYSTTKGAISKRRMVS